MAEEFRKGVAEVQGFLGEVVELIRARTAHAPQPVHTSTLRDGQSESWSRQATGGTGGCLPDLISSYHEESVRRSERSPFPEVRCKQAPKQENSSSGSYCTPSSSIERISGGAKVKVNQNLPRLLDFWLANRSSPF